METPEKKFSKPPQEGAEKSIKGIKDKELKKLLEKADLFLDLRDKWEKLQENDEIKECGIKIPPLPPSEKLFSKSSSEWSLSETQEMMVSTLKNFLGFKTLRKGLKEIIEDLSKINEDWEYLLHCLKVGVDFLVDPEKTRPFLERHVTEEREEIENIIAFAKKEELKSLQH